MDSSARLNQNDDCPNEMDSRLFKRYHLTRDSCTDINIERIETKQNKTTLIGNDKYAQ